MYIKKKINRSGSVSVVVSEKIKGSYKEYLTIGIGNSESEVAALVLQGKEWIRAHQLKSQPELDLYGEEREACEQEKRETEEFLSNIDNTLINGDELILNRVFDRIGFNVINEVENLIRGIIYNIVEFITTRYFALAFSIKKRHFALVF